jgi:hypothetical protein
MEHNDHLYIEIPASTVVARAGETIQNDRKLLWNLCAMIGIPAATLAIIATIFFIRVK